MCKLTMICQTTDFILANSDLADNNFEFDENAGNLSKTVENTLREGKLLVIRNLSFSHSVFKRLVQQVTLYQRLKILTFSYP